MLSPTFEQAEELADIFHNVHWTCLQMLDKTSDLVEAD